MEYDQVMHPLDEEDTKLELKLQKCMEALKKEQRDCVSLFYYESKSYHEICKKLNLDLKAVKSLIQNGKRNLKICLEKNNVR